MTNKSPKATFEKYVGNHIENLAARPLVFIEPIGKMSNFDNLPIWINKDIRDVNPEIYSHIFWEIEPMGEYIYFLAGDFEKNEKGLLRFPSATTSMRVEVNFEDDVISVAKHDGKRFQDYAKECDYLLPTIQDMSIEDLEEYFNLPTQQTGDSLGYISLETLLPQAEGFSRIEIGRNYSGKVYLGLIYQGFYEPKKPSEYARYMLINVYSTNRKQKIQPLIDEYIKLVKKYKDMPYISISGTTRG
ncbi:hypothetical protein [Psychrobacter sp. I-STPA6b]|uniref:hypothetical protein n=1 Tax=Psychrobacter sp. I-STPA6b TaxID=2585718 RepID=UPI001D0CBF9D|nr:hypothetical protein [Psychrobacter sp. I-STPA6b]